MHREDVLALVGRLLLALIFLAAAFGKITNFDATCHYMEVHGIPMPVLFCAAAAAIEVLGSISLLLGYRTRFGAVLLAAFLLTATAVFYSTPDQRIQLLKNLAIVGGLLQIVAFGPGEWSLDGRRSR